MRVKPKNARAIVRDPITKEPLPVGGKKVPNNSFWRRRIKAGDVVVIPEIPPAPPAASPPSPSTEPAAPVEETITHPTSAGDADVALSGETASGPAEEAEIEKPKKKKRRRGK